MKESKILNLQFDLLLLDEVRRSAERILKNAPSENETAKKHRSNLEMFSEKRKEGIVPKGYAISLTHCGDLENFDTTRASSNLERKYAQMLRSSILLRGINVKAMDFKYFMIPFVNDEKAFVVLDPPYIKSGKDRCEDYKDEEFTMKDMKRLMKKIKTAKCKIVFYHSDTPEIRRLCKNAGLTLRRTYEAVGRAKYTTLVYTKNLVLPPMGEAGSESGVM